MANLKELKNRIASVKNTRKITKAMQMVAAAKLRRAQEAAEQSRPYTTRFNAVMGGLAASVGGSGSAPKLLSGTGSDQVQLMVVMTSERGLCGGFNSNIVKKAKAHANALKAEGKTVKILTVGKKGRDQMKREYGDLYIGHVDLTEVKRVGYTDAQGIAKGSMGAQGPPIVLPCLAFSLPLATIHTIIHSFPQTVTRSDLPNFHSLSLFLAILFLTHSFFFLFRFLLSLIFFLFTLFFTTSCRMPTLTLK